MSNKIKFANKYFKKSLLISSVRFVVPLALLVNADENLAATQNKWRPQLELNGKIGTKRHIGRVGALAPILQSPDSILFLDLRFMADSRRDQEGNFGLGYRWLNEDKSAIWGVYGYYDRRHTAFGSKVNQATFGFERLSDTWDYRANAYMPQKKSKVKISDEATMISFSGYDMITTQSAKKEVPLAGLDMEVGRSIPGAPNLRIFGGGYFYAGRDGAKSIKGIQARSTYSVNEYVSLAVEVNNDNVRKTNAYAGVEVKIPLGADTKTTRGLTALEKRMVDTPIRDVDVVATQADHSVKTIKNGHRHAAEDGPEDGNGTFERPYKIGSEKHKAFVRSLYANKDISLVHTHKNGVLLHSEHPVDHVLRHHVVQAATTDAVAPVENGKGSATFSTVVMEPANQKELEELRQKAAEHQGLVENLTNQLDGAKATALSDKSEILQLRSENQDLRAKSKEIESKLQGGLALSEAEELKAQYQQAKDQISQNKTRIDELVKSKEVSDETVRGLQGQLFTAQETVSDLTGRLEQKEIAMQQQQTTVDTTIAKNTKLQVLYTDSLGTIKGRDAEIAQQKKDLAAITAERDALQQSINDSKLTESGQIQRLNELNAQLTVKENEVLVAQLALTQQEQKSRESIDAIERNAKANDAKMQQQIATKSTELQATVSDLTAAKKNIKALQTQIEQKNAEFVGLTGDKSKQEITLAQLNAELEKQKAAQAALEVQLANTKKENEQDIENLKKRQKQEADVAKKLLEKMQSQHAAEIASQKAAVDAKAAELKTLSDKHKAQAAELIAIQSQLSAQTKALAEKDAALADVNAALAEAQAGIVTSQASLDKARTHVASLESVITEKLTELQKANETLAVKTEEQAQLKDDNAALTSELTKTQELADNAKQVVEATAKENQKLSSNLASAQTQVDELTTLRDLLNAENQDAHAQINVKDEAIQNLKIQIESLNKSATLDQQQQAAAIATAKEAMQKAVDDKEKALDQIGRINTTLVDTKEQLTKAQEKADALEKQLSKEATALVEKEKEAEELQALAEEQAAQLYVQTKLLEELETDKTNLSKQIEFLEAKKTQTEEQKARAILDAATAQEEHRIALESQKQEHQREMAEVRRQQVLALEQAAKERAETQAAYELQLQAQQVKAEELQQQLKAAYDSNQVLIDQHAQTIGELKTQVEDFSEATTVSNASIANLSAQVEQVTGDKTQLENSLQLASTKQSDLAAQLSVLQEESEKAKVAGQTEREGLQAEITAAKKDLERAHVQTVEAAKKIAEHEEAITDLNAKLAREKAAKEAATEQQALLEGRVQSLTDAKTQAERNAQNLEAQLQASEKQAVDSDAMLGRLTEQLSELESVLTQNQQAHQQKVNELNATVAQYDKQVQVLKDAQVQLASENEKERQAAAERIREITTTKKAFEEEVNELKAAIASNQDIILGLTDAATKAKEELTIEIKRREIQSQKDQQQLDDLQRKNAELEAQRQAKQEEFEKVKAQFAAEAERIRQEHQSELENQGLIIQEKLVELDETTNDEVDELRDQIRERDAALKAVVEERKAEALRYAEELAEVKEAHQSKLEKFKEKFSAHIESIVTKSRQTLDEQEQAHVEELDAQQAAAEAEAQRTLNVAKIRMEALTQTAEEFWGEFKSTVDEKTTGLDKKFNDLKSSVNKLGRFLKTLINDKNAALQRATEVESRNNKREIPPTPGFIRDIENEGREVLTGGQSANIAIEPMTPSSSVVVDLNTLGKSLRADGSGAQAHMAIGGEPITPIRRENDTSYIPTTGASDESDYNQGGRNSLNLAPLTARKISLDAQGVNNQSSGEITPSTPTNASHIDMVDPDGDTVGLDRLNQSMFLSPDDNSFRTHHGAVITETPKTVGLEGTLENDANVVLKAEQLEAEGKLETAVKLRLSLGAVTNAQTSQDVSQDGDAIPSSRTNPAAKLEDAFEAAAGAGNEVYVDPVSGKSKDDFETLVTTPTKLDAEGAKVKELDAQVTSAQAAVPVIPALETPIKGDGFVTAGSPVASPTTQQRQELESEYAGAQRQVETLQSQHAQQIAALAAKTQELADLRQKELEKNNFIRTYKSEKDKFESTKKSYVKKTATDAYKNADAGLKTLEAKNKEYRKLTNLSDQIAALNEEVATAQSLLNQTNAGLQMRVQTMQTLQTQLDGLNAEDQGQRFGTPAKAEKFLIKTPSFFSPYANSGRESLSGDPVEEEIMYYVAQNKDLAEELNQIQTSKDDADTKDLRIQQVVLAHLEKQKGDNSILLEKFHQYLAARDVDIINAENELEFGESASVENDAFSDAGDKGIQSSHVIERRKTTFHKIMKSPVATTSQTGQPTEIASVNTNGVVLDAGQTGKKKFHSIMKQPVIEASQTGQPTEIASVNTNGVVLDAGQTGKKKFHSIMKSPPAVSSVRAEDTRNFGDVENGSSGNNLNADVISVGAQVGASLIPESANQKTEKPKGKFHKIMEK